MELETPHTHKDIYKAVIKSQHCQRNWDLSKQIPEEDLQILIDSATQCPSKQNIAFYNLHFITDRELIEQIHDKTWGAGPFKLENYPTEYETNPQTLANLLIVFEDIDIETQLKNDIISRNFEANEILHGKKENYVKNMETLKIDAQMAIGIAAGYLNLTASLLGYRTGCCRCFDTPGIKELLNMKNDPVLLMGIGFENENVNRRKHHIRDFTFNTKKKQPISVTFW